MATSRMEMSFTIYDESTIKNLIRDEPDLMPNYPQKKAVARGIDLAYGKKKITENVTQGILQGKSVYKIADDLQSSIERMSRESAVRSARTAFTAAQNAGRQDSYNAAKAMGINMEKEWLATSDERTRETHAEADGKKVDYNKPFKVGDSNLMYPGDPNGEPCEIYNCRCTMVSNVKPNEKPALLQELEKGDIDFNPVSVLKDTLSEADIINKLAGGDQTSGSCASLALSYAANKKGLDVTDYRGGSSRKFFSSGVNCFKYDTFLGTPKIGEYAKSDATAANQLLKKVQPGKEYIYIAGRHAAVVKKDNDGYKYLELQSPFDDQNGWTSFGKSTRKTFVSRFGCSESSNSSGMAWMYDIDEIKVSENYKQTMGYINTKTSDQQKGSYGSVK